MKNKSIFVACDTSNLNQIKRIISQSKSNKLKIIPKFGLQLNYDGRTVKCRVPADKEEASWQCIHPKAPPPRERWVIERAQAACPTEAENAR